MIGGNGPPEAAVQKEAGTPFSVEGKYFEACNCEVSCACIWLGPATEDACDVFFAWHITQGEKDGVDLSGLNAALAVHTSKQMTDGNWRVALYLDDKADPGQAEALGAIFSGAAGGHLANLAPMIGEVTSRFERSHANETCAIGTPRSFAIPSTTSTISQSAAA